MENKSIDLELYCVTNKRIKFLENTNYKLCWVGSEKAPDNYLKCDSGINIFSKEKYYSELTFQYWYWKNMMDLNNRKWVGFCQKRRFWSNINFSNFNNSKNLNSQILQKPNKEWQNYQAIICKSIPLEQIKKIKMLKRNLLSLIKNPTPLFMKNKRTIKFHFDMHHGYGNLDKAIEVMDKKDREEFRYFVNTKTSFNPHIMFITKSVIMNKWFEDLFDWLFSCEKIFEFKGLKGYDTQRLYAYLAERYLPFWFKKYTKALEWDWIFIDYKR